MRRIALVVAFFFPLVLCGCSVHKGLFGPTIPPQTIGGIPNPMFAPALEREFVWNQIVDELDNYFRIRREERMRLNGQVLTEGRIDTFPTVGSSILEPWRRDSTHGFEKLHASLQSIRRFAQVRVVPIESGYQIEVAVFKELEDLIQPEHATLNTDALRPHNSPERTDADGALLPPGTLGWIPLGRDVSLEQKILGNLQGRLGGVSGPQAIPPASVNVNVFER